MKRIFSAVAIMLFLGVSSTALGASLIDKSPSGDVTMSEYDPNNVYPPCDHTNIILQAGTYRSAFWFDISSIPPGSTIDSCAIQMFCWSSPYDAGSGATITTYRATNEGQSECTATWNNYGSDYTHLGKQSVETDYGADFWVNAPCETTLQWFVDNSKSTARWIQRNNFSGDDQLFYSSDYSQSSERPNLDVTYTEPSGRGALIVVTDFLVPGNAYAETEVVERRTLDSKTFQVAPKRYRLEVGNHSHYCPLEALDGNCTVNLKETNLSSPDTSCPAALVSRGADECYSKNRVRVAVDKDEGRVLILPYRDSNTKWLLFEAVNPVTVNTRVVNNTMLEVYKSTPRVEYVFQVTDRGVEYQIKILNQTAPTQYQLNLKVNNLTREGRVIKDGQNVIMRLRAPTFIDANGDYHNVDDTVVGDTGYVDVGTLDKIDLPATIHAW